MRWFLDTEFNEDGRTIELISIGLVDETGTREYYAASSEFREEDCNPWVKQNVLPLLWNAPRRTRRQIADDVVNLVGSEPEFWAYYADYDWVVLCQLFGRMLDLPDTFPMYCRDIKQTMDERGVGKGALPKQQGSAHSAIDDARWVRAAWLHLFSKPSVV